MKKLNATYVSLTSLVLAIVALVLAIMCCCCKKNNVEEALMNKPEIIVNAMQKFEAQQRENAEKEAQKLMQENAEALNNNANDGVLGNPEGKIVLVEFFDYSCGYCHKVYPVLKNIIANNADLKVVAKPLAFLSPMSNYAAKASLAAKEQGKFAEVYSAIFEIKGQMTEAKIDEAAVLAGADLEKLKADMNSDKVKNVMNETSELASKLRISGVPTLILNGKVVRALDEDTLQKAIDATK